MANKITDQIKKIFASQLAIPLVALIVLVVFNLIRDPSFFSIAITKNNFGNTVLSGNLVSILNGASELVLLSIGMTLVTSATKGQDISIGAAAAIAGSVFVKILRAGNINTGTILIGVIFGKLNPDGIQGSAIGSIIMSLMLGPVISLVGKPLKKIL